MMVCWMRVQISMLFGLVAYEMLTGQSAFSGDSPMELLMARVNQVPTPVSELATDCPLGVERIIMKALAREPENRYQTAAEMFFRSQRESGLPYKSI